MSDVNDSTASSDVNEGLDALVARAHESAETTIRATQAMLDGVVVVPSGGDFINGADAFTPVLVPIDGTSYVAVFTTAEGLSSVSHLAPFAATIPGRDLVRGLSPELGLLVTATHGSMTLSPQLLERIRADES